MRLRALKPKLAPKTLKHNNPPSSRMKFTETPSKGAFVIDLEKRGDDRGFFARFFCEREYQQHGLNHRIVQINNSLEQRAAPWRGCTISSLPKSEDKVVRCIRGALLDSSLTCGPTRPP